MREIKIRVWACGKMHYPSSFEFNVKDQYGNNSVTFNSNDKVVIVSSNIMQYTGLKDKNGTDIYDGDIVRSYKAPKDNPRYCSVITWSEDAAGFDLFGSEVKMNYEVIGNIYDNPELSE